MLYNACVWTPLQKGFGANRNLGGALFNAVVGVHVGVDISMFLFMRVARFSATLAAPMVGDGVARLLAKGDVDATRERVVSLMSSQPGRA